MITAQHSSALPQGSINTANASAAVAWISIVLGAVSGLIMGLWSFDGPFPTPEWIGAYDDLPRRFLRLAHVAFFALGILHFLVARQIKATPVSPMIDDTALRLMAFGNIAMPVFLIAAAVWEPFKYLTSLPATALTFAFAVAAYGAIHTSLRGAK
jgi:hypothetical protein